MSQETQDTEDFQVRYVFFAASMDRVGCELPCCAVVLYYIASAKTSGSGSVGGSDRMAA